MNLLLKIWLNWDVHLIKCITKFSLYGYNYKEDSFLKNLAPYFKNTSISNLSLDGAFKWAEDIKYLE